VGNVQHDIGRTAKGRSYVNIQDTAGLTSVYRPNGRSVCKEFICFTTFWETVWHIYFIYVFTSL